MRERAVERMLRGPAATVAVLALPMLLALDVFAGRATCTVEEAGRFLGLGRSAAYAAAERGDLPTLRLGRRILVPVPKLLALVGAEQEGRKAVESGAFAQVSGPPSDMTSEGPTARPAA
jgi:excisionase family DNA binding protein